MAKKSAVNRNEMVKRLVKQYAAKRDALKAIANDESLPLEERFDARLKLAEAAAQLVADPHPQPLRGHRPSARLLPQAEDEPDRAARPGLRTARSPAWSSRAGRGGIKWSTIPSAIMIARIKNAADAQALARCRRPASKMRAPRARRAAGRRLHPRLRPGGEARRAFPEFEIELKYFDGEPVIAEIARVSKPGRRVYSSIKDLKPVKNGLGHLDPVDAQGRHVRHRRPRRQRGRRSPLPGLLSMSRIGKKAVADPLGRHRHARRPDRHGEGPQGPARLDRGRRDRGQAGGRRADAHAARRQPSAPAPCGACRAPWWPTWSRASPRATSSTLELVGVGYRAAHEGPGALHAARLLATTSTSRRRRASPSPCPSRPKSRSPASTSSWSAKSPPASAASVRPSPTRARACATPARRSAARKARRSKPWRSLLAITTKRRAQRTRTRLKKLANGRPRLSVFRSAKNIYAQVIDDAQRRHPGRRLVAGRRQGRQGLRQGRRRRASASWSPSAPSKRASRTSSSTAAATSITAGSRPWPTPRVKPA